MTAQLALPLGGWSPNRDLQRSALAMGLSDPGEASELLEGLGVPEPAECVRHLRRLATVTDEALLDDLIDLLARSPDPTSATRSLTDLFDTPTRPRLSERSLTAFVSLASQSAFFGRFLSRQPEVLVELTESGTLTEARSHDVLSRRAGALLELLGDDPTANEAILALALRHQRCAELARIFYREVQGLATVDMTGREVSDLAAALIDATYRAARRLVDRERAAGETGAALRMSVIGLGKLGARELNFSSDVDLLFVANDVVTTRPELARYGELVAKRTRALLDRPMAGSRVFRVDLRLRPDGSRGPLISFPRGLRDYYGGLARTWERAALLRARVIAGDPEPGDEALRLLEPIRHPRSVDPSAIDDLRAMKDRIDRHESWRGHTQRLASGWDTKVGRGGIREVEFIVAAFQYLLAGREPQLRGLSTYQGLGRLAALALIDPADARDLDEAYRFYRLLEHRLQMDEDRQTQRLPSTAEARHLLARRLGFAGWSTLDARLEGHRVRVREIFERTLAVERAGPKRRQADEVLDALSARMAGRAETEEVIALLVRVGFRRPRSALGALRVLWRRSRGPMSAQSIAGADGLPAYLLDAVLQAPDPDAAMRHLFALLIHPHGSAAVRYLRAKPATLRSVMTLLGASDFLARKLTRSPWWIDRIVGGGTPVLQTRDQLAESWSRTRTRAPQLEARLNLLRRFRASQVVRIAMAYLEGVFDDAQLADQLTLVAELALTAVVDEARADLANGGPLADFLVIGMGRLGSREMGFGSDLDLVFAYEGTVDEAARYARLARRLIHFLNTPMPDGILYQTDLRLRPWGNKGTVVTTIERFGDYYANRADPWERIALVRGRPVAGPTELRARFQQARRPACRLAPEGVAAFVSRLDRVRTRLLHEVAKPQTGRYHLKYGPGGLMEIELLVQIGRLTAMGRLPEETVEPNPRLLDTIDWLRAVDALAGDEAAELSEAYLFFRRLQNVLRLTLDRSVDHLQPGEPALRRAHQLLGRRTPELADPSALEAAIGRHVAAVGHLYRRTVRDLTGRDAGVTP